MRTPFGHRPLPGRLLDRLLEAEAGRFSLWLAPAVVAGVVLYFALPAEPPPWAGPVAAGVLLAASTALRRRLALYPCALLAAASLGLAAASLATWRAAPMPSLPHRAVTITARVAEVELLPQGRRLVLAGARLGGAAPLARNIRVRLRNDDATPLTAGSRISVRALLFAPSPPAWPGGWDLQRDAYFSNLAGYGFALGKVTVLGATSAGLFARLRSTIRARVAAAVPGVPGAIAATLLTGAAIGIPPADRAAFAASGLAHLLAIAGLHIGILMGLVFLAVRLALALSEHASLFWPTKSLAALAALAAGGFYMELTGAHLPIERSFLMASLVVLALLAGRRALSMRGLMLAMAGLAALEPQAVPGPSFQMSFAAVLALIAGYRALEPALARLGTDPRWHRRALRHVVMLLTTSLLAGSASAPFAAWHFGRMQVYFVLSNVFAVPLTAAWTMPLGLVSLMLMPLHLERLALVPMGWGCAATLAIARFFAGLPAASLAVPHAPPWGLLLVALGLTWLCLWRSRLRLAGLALLAAGLASAWLVRPPDLLVARNTVAVRRGAQVLTATIHGRQAFTLEQFQVRLPGPQAPLDCPGTTCPLAPGATLLLASASPCPQGLVIAFATVACGPGTTLIDAAAIGRSGSVAIWLGPRPTLLTDLAVRGDRPWVILGTTPRRPGARRASVQARVPVPVGGVRRIRGGSPVGGSRVPIAPAAPHPGRQAAPAPPMAPSE
ncbi:MAG: ComEC/Rec2 family competence protein [Rhodospirillales bacterium]|nr:ComEC/Rec2 family competence protein [Rhodospirillales bacterium]